MPTETTRWPRHDALRDHWSWRPEWRTDRPCLYWYLTFDRDAVAEAVGPALLEAIGNASWMDPVPLEWAHLTLCDLGFLDQVPDRAVERAVRGVADLLTPDDLATLTVGPLAGMESAVVLVAEPLAGLRDLQRRVRMASEAALGGHRVVHRGRFWPHVSLGYVNRSVSGRQVRALTDAFDHLRAPLPVGRLVLAAVTRERHHYQWSVEADLTGSHATHGD